MAQITFTGFVEAWSQNNPQHPDWAMKTAEPHRKRDGDSWVTVGRTFRTVKAGYADGAPVGIDFTRFAKGDRVTVSGVEVTEVREVNGKKFYDLVVKATDVALAEPQGGRGGSNGSGSGDWATQGGNGPQTGAQGSWDVDDSDSPF